MSDKLDNFFKNIDSRCIGCEYAKSVFGSGGWMFLGCYHTPYRGKRVSEITTCPRKTGEPNE